MDLKVQYQPYLAHVCGEDDGLTEDSLSILLLRFLRTTLYPPKNSSQITPLRTTASGVIDVIIKRCGCISTPFENLALFGKRTSSEFKRPVETLSSLQSPG